MKTYDIVVIGSGAGSIIMEEALNHNFSAALIDRGPIGGTCLNLGCIPSKMLIYPADCIRDIQTADRLGVHAKIIKIDFPKIMKRMRQFVSRDRESLHNSLKRVKALDLYEENAFFIDKHTIKAGKTVIKGDKIVIAAGASPLIPGINGLDKTGFLTNKSVLQLSRKPESLIIIGGGYIAAEYGHFFSAMGTRVTIIGRDHRLVNGEEPEISRLLEKKLSERMHVLTSTEAIAADSGKGRCTVTTRNLKNGRETEYSAEKIMVAAGRASNAPGLKVNQTGVDTDASGYIVTNAYMETSQKNIWAVGDNNGKAMFRHAANYEAMLVGERIFHNAKIRMDYNVVPHAVFSYPEIASVGMTQSRAIDAFGADKVMVGYSRYNDTARGAAMMETEGFAKAIVEKETGVILGFHVIGPHASILIQEVVNVILSENGLNQLMSSMHIHPALTEVVQGVFANLEEIRL